ncbi:metallophosphoesterase [Candidatus Bathyarchaeota archaeon]|nr:metallophosphoesterase [Candidatus Bathyarchaeota archaeon]
MPFFRLGRKKEKEELTRILFATDVHGATQTFLKFVNAAKFYGVDALILGGDITGKMVIPIIEQSDGSYEANFMDTRYTLKSAKELKELENKILFVGFYPYYTNEEEIKALTSDQEKAHKIFMQLMCERIKEWIGIAEERLKNTDIKCFITGGNDDPLEVTQLIKNLQSEHVINPEEVKVFVDGHEMISCGWGNITPWKCARDISEDELAEKIEAMTDQVEDMRSCIFNFHVPPINSTLDTCVKLDLSAMPPRPIIGEFVNAGSVAVRDAIMKHQPLLGLHGHIHESRGAIKIGRTLCINPGSEYSEGILRAAIINIAKDKILSYQFVSG